MAATKQPFGIPTIQKKNEQLSENIPKKSTVRESCKNMFLEALKETPNYSEDFYKEFAENIENMIYSVHNNDKSKEYRDKVNALKMKLKGSRNSLVRSALFDQNITIEQFVNSSNLTEILEQIIASNPSVKAKPEHPVANVIQKTVPIPVHKQPIHSSNPPFKNSSVPIQSTVHEPPQKILDVQHKTPETQQKNQTSQKNIPQKTNETQKQVPTKLPENEAILQKQTPKEKNQKQPPPQKIHQQHQDAPIKKSNGPEKLQYNVPHTSVETDEQIQINKKTKNLPMVFDPKIISSHKEEQKPQEETHYEQIVSIGKDIEITYEKAGNEENYEVTQEVDEMEKELQEFERLRQNLNKQQNEENCEDYQNECEPDYEGEEKEKCLEYNQNENFAYNNEECENNNDENDEKVNEDNNVNIHDDNNYHDNNEDNEGNEGNANVEGEENNNAINLAGNYQNYQNDYEDYENKNINENNNNIEISGENNNNYEDNENNNQIQVTYQNNDERNNESNDQNNEQKDECDNNDYFDRMDENSQNNQNCDEAPEEKPETSYHEDVEKSDHNQYNDDIASSNQAVYGSKEGFNPNEDYISSFKNENFIQREQSTLYQLEQGEEKKLEVPFIKVEDESQEQHVEKSFTPQKMLSPTKVIETHKETPDQHFIKVLQLQMDLETEKEKYNNAVAHIEHLKAENHKLKNNLDENFLQLAQKEDVETIKRNSLAKEKECEILKKELNDHQQELKLMKSHLNKMIEENSKFKEDYMNFKTLCDQEKHSLKNELASLKNINNDDKIIEIETLKSSNHILEEKLRILTQKLEISKKDCIEKENLLKKMVAFNNLNENDSHLFHNLTAELQKHANSVQNFNQNDHTFKQIFEKETEDIHKVIEQHEKTLVSSHQTPEQPEKIKEIQKETPIKKEIPVIKEQIVEKHHEILLNEPPQVDKGILIQKDQNENKKPEIPQVIKEIEQKIQSVIVDPPNKLFEQKPIENSPKKVLEDPPQVSTKPIDPPPQGIRKKAEETKKNEKIFNQSRNFVPTTFNHPKLANRTGPISVPPKIIDQKKIVSNEDKDNTGEQFFNILASNPQSHIRSNEKQEEVQSITKSEVVLAPFDELRKASPQKDAFIPHNNVDKDSFKTINPNLFSDQKDEFSQLFLNPVIQNNNRGGDRKEQTHSSYIPKQSSNKNLSQSNNRQFNQQPGGSLIKGGPNMESTTSIHSTMTEGDIKKGASIRKGVIPNSLFD